MFERPLFRTSPMGEAFEGQCGECMRSDDKPVDSELAELVEIISEANE